MICADGAGSAASMRLRRLAGAASIRFASVDRVAHGAECGELLGTGRAAGGMRLDLARMTGIEFAVDQRMQQDFRVGAIHGDVPDLAAGESSRVVPSAAFHAERSIDRARASRDITVPTGTPATLAISS